MSMNSEKVRIRKEATVACFMALPPHNPRENAENIEGLNQSR
jgi:hypothetical protein